MKKREYPQIGETLYSDVLPNGLRLYVAPKPGYAKSYAFFATDYGGADRRFKLGGEWIDTPAGVAHFLEHKMFDMPDGNALSILSANGADPNAFTSAAMTAYYFSSTEGFYENLDTLLRFVSTPYFTPESVQKEQGIIGQEIGMTDDNPDFAVYYGLLKCLLAHNPMRDDVAGTAESIAAITPETLYGCHRVFYNPSNMTLCVVGDVDPERVREAALRILPAEAGEQPERDYGPEEAELPVSRRAEKVMEVSMPLFAFGGTFRPAEKGEKMMRQRLTADLALSCLLGDSSPLYNRLYAEGLINNSFDFEAVYSGGIGTVVVSGESRDPEKVMREISAAAEDAAKNGLDAALFERVRRTDYGMRLRALGYFGDLASDLAEGCFAGYCALDAFAAAREITAQEAAAFLGSVLRAEKLALSVVKPREEV